MASKRDACRHSLEVMTRRIVKELDMGWMDIDIQFDDHGTNDVAKVYTQYDYRTATIVWSLQQAMIEESDELEFIAIHELVHVMMGPIHVMLQRAKRKSSEKDILTELEELATQNIARAIRSARRKGTS